MNVINYTKENIDQDYCRFFDKENKKHFIIFVYTLSTLCLHFGERCNVDVMTSFSIFI